MSDDQAQTGQSTNDDTSIATEEVKTYEVGGKQMTADELYENHGQLQWAYTKVTQEKSELEKAPEEPVVEQSAELEEAVRVLKESWFATVDDINAMKEEQQFDQKSDKFFNSNKDLGEKKEAIIELSKSSGLSLEEIAVKYGFSTEDKLEKSKSRGLVWDTQYEPEEPKALKDMTSAEYDIWKKENLTWSGNYSRG